MNSWSSVFTSTWLLYAIIVPLQLALQVDPFALLKVVSPLLYGLNVAGVYYFAKKGLSWGNSKCFLAVLFFSLQLAALRISWDLLRNTLGLGILLFTLALVNKQNTRYTSAAYAALALLTVFSHEYTGVVLIAVVSWVTVRTFYRQKLFNYRLLFASLPAISVFFAGLVLRILPNVQAAEAQVISGGDVINANPPGLFFLVDYLQVNNGVHNYATYLDLATHVLLLFVVLFIPYLYVVLKGFFREDRLDAWTAVLFIGAFGCLFFPFSALLSWHRWMFMLAYPFSLYAAYGLHQLIEKSHSSSRDRSYLARTCGIVSATVLLGTLYLATPFLMINSGNGLTTVLPVNAYFSCSPTVPYQDVDSVVDAMKWLNLNMNESSCAVLHHPFARWGGLYLDESNRIVEFVINGNEALETAKNHDFSVFYTVWWNEDIGWYPDVELPDYTSRVQDFGRISVFVA